MSPFLRVFSGWSCSLGCLGLCHVLLLPPLQQPDSCHAAAQRQETGFWPLAFTPQVCIPEQVCMWVWQKKEKGSERKRGQETSIYRRCTQSFQYHDTYYTPIIFLPVFYLLNRIIWRKNKVTHIAKTYTNYINSLSVMTVKRRPVDSHNGSFCDVLFDDRTLEH